MLRGINLSCIKRDRVLFENLAFTFSAGEIWHLKGPNGAGKTSLLRMMSGLVLPNEGQVQWNDQTVYDNSEFSRQLVFIGHKLGVSSALSAMENLQYWSHLHNVIEWDAFDILDQLELIGLHEIPVNQLSEGQQRRVALSRLWLKPAKIWILDEPFTALDVYAVEQIQNKIKQFVQSGGCVVLTSHQPLTHIEQYQTFELEFRF